MLAGGDKKQKQPSSEGGPAKKKARTTIIELQGVPSDGKWNTDTKISFIGLWPQRFLGKTLVVLVVHLHKNGICVS